MRAATVACAAMLLGAGLLSGCAGARARALGDAVAEYNRGVRWGQSDWAATRVAPGRRTRHMARWAQMRDVRVTACDVRGIRMQGEDRAEVTVQYRWYRESRGRLVDTVVAQTWRRKGEVWMLADQRWVGGAPLALVAAPDR